MTITGEFGVNTANAHREEYSQVIPLADGGFAIVWSSNAGTPAAPIGVTAVLARFHNADGTPRGPAVEVGTAPAGEGFLSGIDGVQLENGNLAFTWSHAATSNGQTDVHARLFDASGGSLGSAFSVAAQSGASEYPNDIVALADGGFAVLWDTTLNPVDSAAYGEVLMRRYGADGTPSGEPLAVNTSTTGKQAGAKATVLANGDTVVTWVDRGSANSSPDFTIRAQRFDAAGAPIGGEVLVSGSSTVTPYFPRIITLEDGRYLIAWRSASPSSFGDELARGQFFTADGTPDGGDVALFQLPSTAHFGEFDLAPLAGGGFAISYSLFQSGTLTSTDPALRVFDSSGRQVGGQLLPIGLQTSAQDFTNAGVLANGDLVVTWTQPGAAQEIRARILSLPVLSSTLGDDGAEGVTLLENTTAITTFSATSTATEPLTYSIAGGADAALFALDPVTHALRFVERPYAERPADVGADNVYDVIVRVSNGVMVDEQVLAITVAADLSLQKIFGTGGDDKRVAANTKAAVVYGFDGKDTLKGAGYADMLFGGTGNDNLSGGAGNDLIEGGDGNDKLDGGIGNDTMLGGHGNDSYVVDSAGDSVSEGGGSGSDTVKASVNYTLGEGLEKLTLSGNAALAGSGNALANTITGNSGDNVLFGYDGKDNLTGGDGDDWLDGGAQADRLRGGNGADTFAIANPGTKSDRDTILDFAPGADRVAIDRAAFASFNGDAAGVLSTMNFALGSATTADHHLVYSPTTGILSYDADGAGGAAALQIAQFTGLPDLSAGDFVLI